MNIVLIAAREPEPMYVKAFIIALIVGSVLLVINQYAALFGSDELKIIPAVLTYCVPFVVFVIGKHSK